MPILGKEKSAVSRPFTTNFTTSTLYTIRRPKSRSKEQNRSPLNNGKKKGGRSAQIADLKVIKPLKSVRKTPGRRIAVDHLVQRYTPLRYIPEDTPGYIVVDYIVQRYQQRYATLRISSRKNKKRAHLAKLINLSGPEDAPGRLIVGVYIAQHYIPRCLTQHVYATLFTSTRGRKKNRRLAPQQVSSHLY